MSMYFKLSIVISSFRAWGSARNKYWLSS